MRYILDDRGYVKYCSNTYITCENKTCTPYEGTMPEGYETIEEWVQNANIRAYKIADGNLVFDAEEDARLQEEYKKDGKTIYEGILRGSENITLSNAKRFLEIYFTVNYADSNLTSRYIIDAEAGKNNVAYGSAVLHAFDGDGSDYYVSECLYDRDTKILTHKKTGYFSIKNGTFFSRISNDDYYVYRVDTYE